MKVVGTFRRIGFRRWYERELLHSHANLVLLLLATLGLLGCAELWGQAAAVDDRLQLVAGALASAVIGLMALRRYLYLLQHAEFVADQASCSRCDTYAAFDPVGEDAAGGRMQVCCRRCGHRWHITL